MPSTYFKVYALDTLTCTFIVFYIYFIVYKQNWREYLEDPNTASSFPVAILCSIRILIQYNIHIKRIFVFGLARIVIVYGRVRCVAYILFLVLFSYVFVAIVLDVSVTQAWKFVKEGLVRRLEDSIVNVTDDRVYFERVILHPLTQGKTPPRLLHEMYRYRHEDAEFTCKREIVWLPQGRPYVQQVVWRRNGKPLRWSARFSYDLEFQELPENTNELTKAAKMLDLSTYRITAKLRIRFLKSYDFGNYTCHVAEMAQHSSAEWAQILQKRGVTSKVPQQTSTRQMPRTSSPPQSSSNEIAPKWDFEDMYTASQEFHLNEIVRKPKTIKAPPGSILSFRTSFWHIGSEEESVFVEYLINSLSSDEVCTGYFGGCSKFLLLYWMFIYEHQLSMVMPPFKLDYGTIFDPINTHIPHYFQCLCENAYGHHQINFYRQIYNVYTRKFDVVEATHPLELNVLPRKQEMFTASADHPPHGDPMITEPEMADSLTKDYMYYVREAACAMESDFQLQENILTGLGLILSIATLFISQRFLHKVSLIGRNMILEGSWTLRTSTPNPDCQKELENIDKNRSFSKTLFDLYISYSDEDENSVKQDILPLLENHGKTVCLRERDIPPNIPEIKGVSKAVKNSNRFIIVVSPSFLEDRFRKNIELNIICDSACERPTSPSNILVIKLTACEIPVGLRIHTVHDWTTFLSREDHLLKLSRWVTPIGERGLKNELIDIIMSTLPISITALIGMALTLAVKFNYHTTVYL